MKSKKNDKVGAREIPAYKIEAVKSFSEKVKKYRTVLLASTKNLPSSQYHSIKKKFRGKAEIFVAKKSLMLRSISESEKGAIQNLKELIGSDVAVFFSDVEPFELSASLTENMSPTKAKAGDIAPEDINIEPGPTDLVPGPAISELSGVGLKVAVEGGKLAIKQGSVVAKKGEPIKANVAGVLAKLNIFPMKVGFEPIAAFDAKTNKIYTGIKIDKEKSYEELKDLIKKAIGFAINIKYPTQQTIKYFIAKAGLEEKALENKIQTTTKEGN